MQIEQIDEAADAEAFGDVSQIDYVNDLAHCEDHNWRPVRGGAAYCPLCGYLSPNPEAAGAAPLSDWDAFRAVHGPRPGGRAAQARWEAEWARFPKGAAK